VSETETQSVEERMRVVDAGVYAAILMPRLL